MPELSPDRLDGYLLVAGVLFVAGVLAVTTRRSAIGVLIGIELMLNAAALQFAAYGKFSPSATDPQGQTAAVFVVVVAAAEAAVALALLFAVYRTFRDIDLDATRELRS
ncbi:MAG: NADH-quinone oxidoreductase subunit NuoK [Planctomycetes bacterium]|nr:NADH-quinone oxidoreductase subunit NuoK [Planctomycetota bacterium]